MAMDYSGQHKTELSRIRLLFSHDVSFEKIVNGHGSLPQYRDAWHVVRFFSRIIADFEKRK